MKFSYLSSPYVNGSTSAVVTNITNKQKKRNEQIGNKQKNASTTILSSLIVSKHLVDLKMAVFKWYQNKTKYQSVLVKLEINTSSNKSAAVTELITEHYKIIQV